MLLAFKWCNTYRSRLPLCLSALLLLSFCFFFVFGHLSLCLPARRSAARSPKTSRISKVLFFLHSEQEVSPQPTPRLNRWGSVEALDVASSPLPHFPSFSWPFHLLYLSGFLHLSTLFYLLSFWKTSLWTSLWTSPPLPQPPPSAFSCLCRPPTACSHSHGEYVSRKYYHTKLKWKGFFFFFFHLFSFHSTLHYLPSLPAC